MKTIILIGFLLLGSIVKGQDTIYWDETSKLDWNYFIANPIDSSRFESVSCVSFTLSYDDSNTDSLYLIAKAIFIPSCSWTKSRDSSGIVHEQYHFDLEELCVRDLLKSVESYEFTRENFNGEINTIIMISKNQNCRYFQTEYDRISDHGRNKNGQISYEKFIKQRLSERKKYSNGRALIRFKGE